MVEKKDNTTRNVLVIIAVLALLFLFLRQPSELPTSDLAPNDIVNDGAGMNVYVIDETGRILNSLGSANDALKALAVIASPGVPGFLEINSSSLLAFGVVLDNSGGSSQVTLNSASFINFCTVGNTDPLCPVVDLFGPSMVSKYVLPLIVAPGGVDTEKISNGINLDQAPPNSLAVGNVDFQASFIGTFLDQNLDEQPLSVSNEVTLQINLQACADGTFADSSLSTDSPLFCSTNPSSPGKYCQVDVFGNPTLIDKAGLCDCPVGFQVEGDVCVSQSCGGSWSFGDCNPDGGILKCTTGGVIAACNQCGNQDANPDLEQCALVQGQAATACEPPTGEPAQCSYPPLTDNLVVSINVPTFTQTSAQCGDGVKNGAEQCDGTDFGGTNCEAQGNPGSGQLSCTASCTIDTSTCSTGGSFVEFRTGITSYDYLSSCNGDLASGNRWIAYTNSCGLPLVGYGFKTNTASSTLGRCSNLGTEITTIPYTPNLPASGCEIHSSGDQIARLIDGGTGTCSGGVPCTLIICENDNDPDGYDSVEFTTDDPDAALASLGTTSTVPANEVSCTG